MSQTNQPESSSRPGRSPAVEGGISQGAFTGQNAAGRPVDEQISEKLSRLKAPTLAAFLVKVERRLQRIPLAKDVFLVLRPVSTWNALAAKPQGVVFVLGVYLLPLLLLLAGVEGHGLMLHGRQQAAEGMNNRFTLPVVAGYEAVNALLTLAAIFATGAVIKNFANACHARNHLQQCLVVVLQATGPVLLVQLFNGFPHMYVWLTWLAGMFFAVSALYQGLPRILQPDPPAAIGLFCSSTLVFVALMFCGRFLTYFFLIGKLKNIGAGRFGERREAGSGYFFGLAAKIKLRRVSLAA
jgi:hypothetical protein